MIELLVSITIFAVVAASVYSSLYLGIKVWKREAAQEESMYQTTRVVEALARSLRSAFIDPRNERLKFIGTADRLDFFSVTAEGDVENLIVYNSRDNLNAGGTLYLSRKKIRELDNDTPPQSAVLNNNVRVFALRYFDAKDQTWYDEWPEEQRLPNQVRIEFGCGPADNAEEPESLVKYVMIPVANEIDLSESEVSQ